MRKQSRLVTIHNGMKYRCSNPKYRGYKNYGGRGIVVCEEWSNSERTNIGHHNNPTKGFLAFKEWALKNGYADNLTLDRIDFNGNYEPSNCRWVTMQEQRNNTRKNHFITYKGETRTLAQWARIYGVSYEYLRGKVRKWEKIDVNNIFKDLTRR